MTNLFQPCKILKSSLDTYPIIEGQCIFCIDSKEIYIDISNSNRVKVSELGYNQEMIDALMEAL